MKLLFDMGHPAHVHFFKNAIWELQKQGHAVKVTARDKDVTLQLLDAYKIPYIVRPSGWRPLNLITATSFVKKAAKEFKADKLIGVHNPYIAGAAVKLKKPCVLFTDTPGSKFVNRISVDRASKVITPECLAGMFSNQITYPGYKEMAYLHPDVFVPDSAILSKYGIAKDEPFFVVRFIEWSAYHDSGVTGLSDSQKVELIKELSKKGKVIACVEGSVSLPAGAIAVKNPADLHSLLAFSSGYVGEGATMAKEAAVLSKPSVFVSPLEGLVPVEDLCKKKSMHVIEKLDVSKVMKYLESKPTQITISDITGCILKEVSA